MQRSLLGLIRGISRASDLRRAIATHGETEGCEGERETGRFEQRVLSAWMPNYERSPSHLKFADGLQARSTGASRLILMHPGLHSCQALVSIDGIEIATSLRPSR